MKLVICKKPNVAKSIASAQSVTSRADDYFEGNEYLIFGILVIKWRYENIPILPDHFRYVVSEERSSSSTFAVP